ncbi:MAG TPA: hypothetical protein VG478_00160 [Acidimicrobiales bacterium]|jgi:O-antigen/teichoic acid export membrane protein|nr:hypothetical protein [Acidimicrobiales bacterium]
MSGRALRIPPAAASVADQMVSSGSNVLVSVAIGRFAGATELGSYALALLVWLAIIGVQRAVLSEPLIILEADPANPVVIRRALGSAFALALLLAVPVGVVGVVLLAASADALGGPLAAFACVVPVLLGQDLWRAIAFGVHRPERALANDVVFAAVQVTLMVVLLVNDWTSAPWFVLAWGAGAAAGWAYGFVQFRVLPVAGPNLDVLRRLWPTSRWLLWDFLTLFGAGEAYLAVVATIVTAAEFGGLRAAESLLGPSAVILLSGGNVGLPGSARAVRHGGHAALARYSRSLTLAVGAAQWTFCAVMAAIGPWLLGEIYGPEFERFGYLVPILALRHAISVTAFGPSIGIKVAGIVRETFRARLALTAVALPATAVATARFGLAGAAWASVVSALVLAFVLYLVFVPGVARAAAATAAT